MSVNNTFSVSVRPSVCVCVCVCVMTSNDSVTDRRLMRSRQLYNVDHAIFNQKTLFTLQTLCVVKSETKMWA